MDDKAKNDPAADPLANEEFNRTVIVERPERRKSGESTPLHKIVPPLFRKKQEIEDLIGGVNMFQYTDRELDTSAELDSPLSALDTKYTVIEEFAKGGHATVSIARDKNLRRIVAIKSLKKEAEQKAELVDSFVAEAKVTAQLDHPAIIPIYSLSGDDKNGIHLAMKLVNGKTLRDYLRNIALNYRIRGMDNFDEDAMMRRRLELFLHVCDAISYAHHRNIMHRDLKPENIMIGEFMEVFVMDWGLARMIPKEDEAPDSGDRILGTPRYFPPEALRGERCDARADIFTLGLILQEVVTLRPAVGGNSAKEYMERIVNGELEPVRHRFGKRVDRALQAIIRKATAYRVCDRYQTVDDLSEDLRRYMGGLSVAACPDDIFMKVARGIYRYRRPFVMLFVAVLLGSALVTSYSIYRQLQISRDMTMQRRAMNYIYNRTAVVADHLDITTLHIQEQLSALSRIAAYLISYNGKSTDADAEKAFHPPMDQIKAMEPGMFVSPYYKRLVGLDYGICTTAPNADAAMCRTFRRKVAPVLTKMKNIVLGSKSGYGFAKEDYAKLKAEYLNQGFPIRSVFIGSRCGVKLLYPWRGNYSRNIDPRERLWYKNALQTADPVWGKPYMDIDSVSGLSIPCSMQIRNLNGDFCGVAGLDVSFNRLTNSILTKGNVGAYVIEKAVINRDGETIFSTRSEYFNKTFDPAKFHQNAEFKTPLFQTPEIRDRILNRGKDYGIFVVEQNGRKVIYSFARLEILKMYYVVSGDYQKLIEHVRKLPQ